MKTVSISITDDSDGVVWQQFLVHGVPNINLLASMLGEALGQARYCCCEDCNDFHPEKSMIERDMNFYCPGCAKRPANA